MADDFSTEMAVRAASQQQQQQQALMSVKQDLASNAQQSLVGPAGGSAVAAPDSQVRRSNSLHHKRPQVQPLQQPVPAPFYGPPVSIPMSVGLPQTIPTPPPPPQPAVIPLQPPPPPGHVRFAYPFYTTAPAYFVHPGAMGPLANAQLQPVVYSQHPYPSPPMYWPAPPPPPPAPPSLSQHVQAGPGSTSSASPALAAQSVVANNSAPSSSNNGVDKGPPVPPDGSGMSGNVHRTRPVQPQQPQGFVVGRAPLPGPTSNSSRMTGSPAPAFSGGNSVGQTNGSYRRAVLAYGPSQASAYHSRYIPGGSSRRTPMEGSGRNDAGARTATTVPTRRTSGHGVNEYPGLVGGAHVDSSYADGYAGNRLAGTQTTYITHLGSHSLSSHNPPMLPNPNPNSSHHYPHPHMGARQQHGHHGVASPVMTSAMGLHSAPAPPQSDADENQSLAAESIADSVSTTAADSIITINSFADSFLTQSSRGSTLPPAEERRLEQRQKQIDYGKNTIGYDRYRDLVPRNRRKKGDPQTPDKHMKCSKRCWDGLIRAWRRKLHQWDPPDGEEWEPRSHQWRAEDAATAAGVSMLSAPNSHGSSGFEEPDPRRNSAGYMIPLNWDRRYSSRSGRSSTAGLRHSGSFGEDDEDNDTDDDELESGDERHRRRISEEEEVEDEQERMGGDADGDVGEIGVFVRDEEVELNDEQDEEVLSITGTVGSVSVVGDVGGPASEEGEVPRLVGRADASSSSASSSTSSTSSACGEPTGGAAESEKEEGKMKPFASEGMDKVAMIRC
ncbi:hypothetical protein BJ742DRAFT_837886 [Cladochytrium replicatum]|nr:hypothetical protein BJ742DRAFT_837886 [Cladochytrium replicatum]